jgi:hypothetical protein
MIELGVITYGGGGVGIYFGGGGVGIYFGGGVGG